VAPGQRFWSFYIVGIFVLDWLLKGGLKDGESFWRPAV